MTDEDLKKKIESVLFAAGTKVSFDEICKLIRERNADAVLHALEELRAEYDQRNGSLAIFQDGPHWKLTVREHFLPLVRKIVTQTELPRSVMETLAIVASKAPVLQSKIVSIRTNKAYDHLAELENAGYVTREKKGRTKLVKLAQKFFQYFDVPEDRVKEQFARVAELEQAVTEKEDALEREHTALKEKQHEAKQKEADDKQKSNLEHQRLDNELNVLPPIQLVDAQGQSTTLEVFDEPARSEIVDEPVPSAPGVEIIRNEINGLEVVDIPPSPQPQKHKKKHKRVHTAPSTPNDTPVPGPTTETGTPHDIHAHHAETHPERKWSGKGVFSEGIPEDVARKIDERVHDIVEGERNERDASSADQPPDDSTAEQPQEPPETMPAEQDHQP